MLDDQELNRELTKDDQAYLEEFKNVAILSFTNTKITSLKNFPALAELRRIELNGNDLSGAELVHLLQYKANLHTLKFQKNNVTSFAELEAIKELTLCNLDLSENPIAAQENYRKKVFAIFEDLEVLDGEDKEGNIVESDDEDDGEEGEFDELDEEQLKKLREQGLDIGDDEEDGEYGLEDDGEELEYDDEDEDEPSEEMPANKRKK